MKKDAIVKKAKEDNGKVFTIGIIFVGVCLLIFALHWNYLFNAFNGPFKLEKELLETGSMKKHVEIDIPLMPIGSQETGIRVFGTVLGSVETAKYMTARFGDKDLVVVVSMDYSGGPVKGGLTRFPDEIEKQLASDSEFYPVMLDGQIDYILDTDLFMILAVIAFPFALLILFIGLLRRGNPAKHRAISQLRKYGKPLAIVDQIESELSDLPHNLEDSMVFYSDNWVVLLEPSLKIMKTGDLIGFGIERDKSGNKSIALWVRGKMISDTLMVDENKLAKIMGRLREAFPTRYKEDAKGFDKEWNRKRKSLEESIS